MTNDKSSISWKKNDPLIEYGKAYKVIKIDNLKNPQGDVKKVLHYKSVYSIGNQANLFCSIPLDNIELSGVRRPITSKQARQLLNELSTTDASDIDEDADYSDLLSKNSISEAAQMIKRLYNIKGNADLNFSSTKQTQYESAIDQISEEIALILDLSIKEARAKVLKKLRNKK